MFEKALKDSLKAIFDFKKVSYDLPGESLEQECLFINVERAICDINEKVQRARVEGTAYVYANSDKLPYGYFAKRILNAPAKLTSRFFFYEMDENAPINVNIVRRSFRFVFRFDSQYDPNLGIINQVTFEEGDS